MAWADEVAEMNETLLAEFGISATIQRGLDTISLVVVMTPPNSAQSDYRPGFSSAQFRSSDVPGLIEGDRLTAQSVIYRVVEIDRQIENWTKVKLQKVGEL